MMVESKEWTTQKKVLISVICFLVAIAIGMLLSFLFVPKMSLKGEKIVTINIGSEYKDQGVKTNYQGRSINNEVKTSGNVDTSRAGVYTITYVIKKNGYEKRITRTIIVKDIISPIINLKGDQDVYLCPNSNYEELGYEAIDNMDGDITDKVQVINEYDYIIYKVTDEAGNETEIKRTINYKDIKAPTITLKGSSTESITIGSSYKELGYTVQDNCDANLNSKVKVTGSVNGNKLGTYTLTYEVSDTSGNKVSIKRSVRVVEKSAPGVIYLTFDDGPKQGTTNVILDILKEEGVKATFFVTNSGPDNLIKREYDEGHTVALHTASHNYQKVYTSVEGYFNDLNIVSDRVKRLTGIESHIIRFPGGSSNTVSRSYNKGIMTTLTKEVLNRGYSYFDWNVDSNDAGGTTTAKGVYNNVISHLSKKRVNVVLMHDIKSYTRDALRDIIHYGKENGYVFKAITEDTPMVTHRVNN